MEWSIICNAQKGEHYGIDILGLVDRRLTKSLWWTSDDSSLLFKESNKQKVKEICEQYDKNNPRVVPFQKAKNKIDGQDKVSNRVRRWDDHEEIMDNLGPVHVQNE